MAIVRFSTYNAETDWAGKKSFEEYESEARAECAAQGGTNFEAATGWQKDLTVWTWHTHAGLCVREREMNGYDDSDFYMTVYEPATDSFREIMFATTRGWSYPALGSFVDATPEVLAKWQAHQAAAEEAYRKELAIREAARPAKGKTLKVVRGRKVAVGTVGTCFWIGESRWGVRVGIKDATETVHWTAVTNVEVVAA
jgi:hypothetical protein